MQENLNFINPIITSAKAGIILLLFTSIIIAVLLLIRKRWVIQNGNSKNMTNMLIDIKRSCNIQYLKAKQSLANLNDEKQNDLSPFLSSTALTDTINKPEIFFHHLSTGFFNKKELFKISNKLFRLRDKIHFQHETLKELSALYADNFRTTENIYQENLYELSKMHDELSKYMNTKSFNQNNASEWYSCYFTIFGEWFRNGGNKDVAVTHNQIVLKIITLNKLYRYIPFVIQTTESALRCDIAFNNILALNKSLKVNIESFAFYHRLTYKIINLVLNKINPKAADHYQDNLSFGSKKTIFIENISNKTKSKPLLYISLAVFILLTGLYFTGPKQEKETLTATTVHHLPNNKTDRQHAIKKDSVLVDNDSILKQVDKRKTNFEVLYDTKPHPVPFVYGIDISRYQGNLKYELNRLNTLHFLICKATEGLYKVDPEFADNWKFIKEKGFVRGAYHFYHDKDNPVAQADHFLTTIKGMSNEDIPPVIDVEESSLKGITNIRTFNHTLLVLLRHIAEKTKRKPIIYTNLQFANKYMVNDSLSNYPLWLAEYSKRMKPIIPRIWRKKGYIIWQKNDSYKINSGKTDFDIFNGDGHSLIDFIKKN